MRVSVLTIGLVIGLFASPPAASADDATEDGMPPVGHEVWRKTWSWTLVDERGLALGGGGLDASDVEDLRARGFGAVLNYRGEYPQERAVVEDAGLEYLFINSTFAEADMMPVEELDQAVAFIEENLAAGRPVYVHCTGGLHRSAAGVLAYFMKTNGWTYDEAYAHVKSLRPSIMPWFSEALLGYEQRLFGGEKLTVDIWTSHHHIGPDETVPVHALVTDRGTPVAGARVVHLAETGGATAEATTDAEGRARFTFTPAQGPRLQFVSARASLEGFVDGYDRNAYWVDEPDPRPPTVLDVEPLPERVEPGQPFTLQVSVTEEGGEPVDARIAVTTACATLHREFTGWDGRAAIPLTAPGTPGTYAMRVFANRFPVEPVAQTLTLVVGAGGPDPCAAAPPDPATVEPSTPSPAPPGAAAAGAAIPGPGPALALAAVALAAALSRRQHADGRDARRKAAQPAKQSLSRPASIARR